MPGPERLGLPASGRAAPLLVLSPGSPLDAAGPAAPAAPDAAPGRADAPPPAPLAAPVLPPAAFEAPRPVPASPPSPDWRAPPPAAVDAPGTVEPHAAASAASRISGVVRSRAGTGIGPPSGGDAPLRPDSARWDGR